jgi:hypothetical protein
MTVQYTSPLRPLDIGYVSRLAGVAIDWDATDIGAMYPEQMHTRRYGFVAALPREIVKQLDLKVWP